MSNFPQRQPPRFVPTLTQVVVEEEGAVSSAAPQRNNPLQPRTDGGAMTAPPSTLQSQVLTPKAIDDLAQKLEKIVVERLEHRLSQLLQEHVNLFFHDLQEDLKTHVRGVVAQAVAEVKKTPSKF